MLGDVIELTVVVRDLEAAVKDFERMFDLKVYARTENKEFGFKNAVLPLGKGHIELLQPIDPASAAARFLEKHGEGVYLVGFDTKDVDAGAAKLKQRGGRITLQPGKFAWMHPRDAHGLFVELRKPQKYD